nr:f-box protein [Quercus suber]
MMKIYGVEESWTKEFVIARNSPDRILFWEIRPMMILKDGNVLILHDDETLELYDPRRKKFGNIKIKGVSSVLEAVTYVANFGSLRDIVKEDCEGSICQESSQSESSNGSVQNFAPTIL